MTVTGERVSGRSGSLSAPDYWWYRARSRMFEVVFGGYVPPGAGVLDIGSADGPSVEWLAERGHRIATDVDADALRPGDVCASALQLPFGSARFDLVAAFDVIEHVEDEAGVVRELGRVLRPGGALLLSVPAYTWAWSGMDEAAGHYRRYTRRRLIAAVERDGFSVDRATYAFAATFPLFAMDRLRSRLTRREPERPGTTTLPRRLDTLLYRLTLLDVHWLARWNLAFGSSVLLAAHRRA